jgi:hypothetical protein
LSDEVLVEGSFNPEVSKIIEDIEQQRDIIHDRDNIDLIISGDIQVESTTFEEAWNNIQI